MRLICEENGKDLGVLLLAGKIYKTCALFAKNQKSLQQLYYIQGLKFSSKESAGTVFLNIDGSMEWGSKLCMFEATMISDYRGSSTSGLLYNIKLIIRSVRQKAFQHDYHRAMKRNLTFSFDKNNIIEHMWQCRRIFFVTPKYKTRTKLKNIPEH